MAVKEIACSYLQFSCPMPNNKRQMNQRARTFQGPWWNSAAKTNQTNDRFAFETKLYASGSRKIKKKKNKHKSTENFPSLQINMDAPISFHVWARETCGQYQLLRHEEMHIKVYQSNKGFLNPASRHYSDPMPPSHPNEHFHYDPAWSSPVSPHTAN